MCHLCNIPKSELKSVLEQEYETNKNNKYLSKAQLEEYISFSKSINDNFLVNKFESLEYLTKNPFSINFSYDTAKKNFMDLEWNGKNIGKLEKMLDETRMLVEKARYIDDKDLTYKLTELEDEINTVYTELEEKRKSSRNTKIKVGIGVALTLFTIAEPYFADQIKEKFLETKNRVENLFVQDRVKTS